MKPKPKKKVKQPKEHSYKDMIACGCLVYITMRCIEFGDKDFTEYMDFYGSDEFLQASEAAKTLGLYNELLISLQWIQIFQNLIFLRIFKGDLYGRTWYRPVDYYMSVGLISCRLLNLVRIYKIGREPHIFAW